MSTNFSYTSNQWDFCQQLLCVIADDIVYSSENWDFRVSLQNDCVTESSRLCVESRSNGDKFRIDPSC